MPLCEDALEKINRLKKEANVKKLNEIPFDFESLNESTPFSFDLDNECNSPSTRTSEKKLKISGKKFDRNKKKISLNEKKFDGNEKKINGKENEFDGIKKESKRKTIKGNKICKLELNKRKPKLVLSKVTTKPKDHSNDIFVRLRYGEEMKKYKSFASNTLVSDVLKDISRYLDRDLNELQFLIGDSFASIHELSNDDTKTKLNVYPSPVFIEYREKIPSNNLCVRFNLKEFVKLTEGNLKSNKWRNLDGGESMKKIRLEKESSNGLFKLNCFVEPKKKLSESLMLILQFLASNSEGKSELLKIDRMIITDCDNMKIDWEKTMEENCMIELDLLDLKILHK
ncbi:hypothetical protein SNEBB_010804 [Seison nebaliae]|nr:hypothetical protein SNEBB_010804 [Seison nebaliae]